ncbi:MAG TPA: zinc-binding dehydrogenase [Candidatus Binataceae bacterium]|nr:zinc-binding dehydrogenase [Candidatus Binataceae bacterium]
MENPTVVFRRPREVVLEDRPVPRPKPGALLIESTLSLISMGTELTILSGEFPEQSMWANYGRYPFVAGYSNVGRVVDVGEGVEKDWIGTRVATRTPHAAWVSAPARAAARIPEAVSDQDAGLFAIATIVMNGIRRGQITWGECVAVFGLGILGQLAVRFAELAGARAVFGIDVADSRIALLPKSPAIGGLNARRDDLLKSIRAVNHGRPADVAFEVTGDPTLLPGEFEVLRRQGRFVVLSSPRGPSNFDFHDLCNAAGFTIIGAHELTHPSAETLDHPWTHQRHYELFFDLLETGRLEVGSLVRDHVRYRDAPELYAKLLADRSAFMAVELDWRQ